MQQDLIKSIIRLIVSNILYIFLFLIFFLFLWSNYFYNTKPAYQVKTVIQIKENTPISSFDYSGMSGQSLKLDEQIFLYKSRSNIISLINYLNLDIKVNQGNYFKNPYIELEYLNFNVDQSKIYEKLVIKKTNDNVSILDSDNNEIISNIEINQDYSINDFSFKILKLNFIESNEIDLMIYRENYQVNRIASTISSKKLYPSRSSFVEGSLVEFSTISTDIELAKQILNKANEIFINYSKLSEQEEATLAVNYIESQITNVENNLKESQKLLNEFKEENTSIDLDIESRSIIEESLIIEEQINNLNLKLADYNELYNPSNPIYKRLVSQLDELSSQKANILNKINSLPKKQQKYIELFRNTELNQKLYETLLETKLNYSLTEAATIGNVKIVDNPYLVGRVSPRFLSSLISFMILFGIFVSIFLYIRSTFFTILLSPDDISFINDDIRTVGTIGNKDEDMFEHNITSSITNLLNYMRKELPSSKDANIIQIVGATKEVGKSFIAYNFANSLAALSKKVLLIDLDYKRGDIHHVFNLKPLKSNPFISANKIEDFHVNDNLYVIPRMHNAASNALSIIESFEFEDFIHSIKEHFDFIIFDTPPALALPEVASLSRFADITIPVFRHKITKIKDVKRFFNEMKLIGNPLKLYVYNGVFKSSILYGYDYYAYRYYQGYNYYQYDKVQDE